MRIPFQSHLTPLQICELAHRSVRREYWEHRLISVYGQKDRTSRWERARRIRNRVESVIRGA